MVKVFVGHDWAEAHHDLDRQGGAPWMGSGHRGRSDQHGVRVSRSRLLLVTSSVAVRGLVLDRGATP